MHSLRQFFRSRMAGHVCFFIMAAVLLARAILPAAVMIDFGAAARGDFALVLCSGNGPMFVNLAHAEPGMSHADMSALTGAAHGDMQMSASGSAPAHDSGQADAGICPFSAALFTACLALVLAAVFLAAPRVLRVWRRTVTRRPWLPWLHARPLSRAPPVFS